MGTFVTYGSLMVYILPICCSVICSVFALLLIWNYRNPAERKLRRVVSIYCTLIAVWWASVLWHELSDNPVFLPVDIPFALSYLYIPVLFYNIVYYLTYLGNKRNFPVLNYLWPLPASAIILTAAAWILPHGEGIAGLSPAEHYTYLFISGFLLRFVTAIAYIVPTCRLLSRYYKQAVVQKVDADRKSFSIRSSHWLVVLFVLFIAIWLIAFLPSVVCSDRWLVRLNALCIMVQEILLTYHVIRRQYLSYKTSDLFPAAGKKSENNGLIDKQRLAPDHAHGPLSRKAFENYLSQKKPYLDPDFKLTDMAEAMGGEPYRHVQFHQSDLWHEFSALPEPVADRGVPDFNGASFERTQESLSGNGYGGIQRLPPFPACDPIGKGGQGTAGRGTAGRGTANKE